MLSHVSSARQYGTHWHSNVCCGLEFYLQLKSGSFEFNKNSSGQEKVTMNNETRPPKIQDGDETFNDKHMYETGKSDCPIAMLEHFLEETDKTSLSLFNRCDKNALCIFSQHQIWYGNETPGKSSFVFFMQYIRKMKNVVNVIQITVFELQQFKHWVMSVSLAETSYLCRNIGMRNPLQVTKGRAPQNRKHLWVTHCPL